VSDTIEWTGPEVARDGVIERELRLSRAAGTVPAVLWHPSAPASQQNSQQNSQQKPPLVLLGHSGSGHKRNERNVGLARPGRAAGDGSLITAPTLLHVQWHDELFPLDGQLALFEALGSADKELLGYSGPHEETKPQAIARWREFVAGHLTGKSQADRAEPGSVRDSVSSRAGPPASSGS
jgi:hypothetical protein